MKYLLIILLAVSLTASAQKDTSTPFFTFNVRTAVFTSDEYVTVSLYEDSAWEVKGDSLAAIKLLWNRWHESAERESKTWAEYDKLYKAYESAMKNWKETLDIANEIQGQKTELTNVVQRTAAMIERRETAVANKGNPDLVKWVIIVAVGLAIIVICIALWPFKPSHKPVQ